jgi:hypothetical protein
MKAAQVTPLLPPGTVPSSKPTKQTGAEVQQEPRPVARSASLALPNGNPPSDSTWQTKRDLSKNPDAAAIKARTSSLVRDFLNGSEQKYQDILGRFNMQLQTLREEVDITAEIMLPGRVSRQSLLAFALRPQYSLHRCADFIKDDPGSKHKMEQLGLQPSQLADPGSWCRGHFLQNRDRQLEIVDRLLALRDTLGVPYIPLTDDTNSIAAQVTQAVYAGDTEMFQKCEKIAAQRASES